MVDVVAGVVVVQWCLGIVVALRARAGQLSLGVGSGEMMAGRKRVASGKERGNRGRVMMFFCCSSWRRQGWKVLLSRNATEGKAPESKPSAFLRHGREGGVPNVPCEEVGFQLSGSRGFIDKKRCGGGR
jgi:hypothetical protein